MNTQLSLQTITDSYMEQAGNYTIPCQRCLSTSRWNGSVVLMIIDAAFTSVGLNYFTAVIPAVERFEKQYVNTHGIKSLHDLAHYDEYESFYSIWKNKRSWNLVKHASRILSAIQGNSDRTRLRTWAKTARIENWKKNPIGNIKGVGINTFQYLRMMGGIDTAMPDKIVKRVISSIWEEAGIIRTPLTDFEFIHAIEELAHQTGYKTIELCWMTWLIQSEGEHIRSHAYDHILSKI